MAISKEPETHHEAHRQWLTKHKFPATTWCSGEALPLFHGPLPHCKSTRYALTYAWFSRFPIFVNYTVAYTGLLVQHMKVLKLKVLATHCGIGRDLAVQN